ncbi:VapC toxin family PIN domain ribonuclease [Brasilonema octagenarum UFV-E1]|uniref:VapC toxin family PIN domain ribonuclease n=2 Tax=Brasilonema TaxID=383614 RepID=A0A856MND8_9CYAN|nr:MULTISPECIES: type II toxin-antitoxin system VapC family toxin [Brasilonema]NMF63171.1 VapC toxin family PIN domain ribonuclease [Brasilonema octagenarum UFV-OR1]QDL12012.1 VapC toxin family PIN domain ribonuclease [Brasilonema sennae CENA114]QDL18387.1 VapC toxin family PIN domain ribonuclease [Brasilonema octagenarum UFV-E1]
MRFLLDTNMCIYIIKRKPPKVFEKFQTLDIFDVAISSITVAELEYGVYKSQRREQNQAALTQFLIPLEIIPFDASTTQTYGRIRADLERQGIVVGSMDMLIASQAISLGLILVTNNVRELSRIPGLVLENWVD